MDDESFYATNRPPAERIRRHDQYDRYVSSEVVPFVRDKGRTSARIGTLGASFGAYQERQAAHQQEAGGKEGEKH